MFARHGIPKLVFSDNGPEFPSLEFRKFSANWDFEVQIHHLRNTNQPQLKQMVQTRVGRKVYPPCRMLEYTT